MTMVPLDAVCFDFRGTLIDHRTDAPIPEMLDVLERLSGEGVRLAVVSRFPEHQLQERLGRLSAYFGDRVYSSSQSDKLTCLRQLAADHGITDLSAICFVDDKPANLIPVAEASSIRVIGFRGSNKYPETAAACKQRNIPYAGSVDALARIIMDPAAVSGD